MAENTESTIQNNGIPEITYELRTSSVITAATDKTLTADGEPADAATVGNRFASVEQDVSDLATDFADTVKYTVPASTPSDARKLQALANIGGVGVLDQSSVFNTTQKEQARTNIGALGSDDAVLLGDQTLTTVQMQKVLSQLNAVGYVAQTGLSPAQKTQARTNIGAADADDVTYAVKFTPQTTFSDDQKAQARTNIGAASSTDMANTVRTTASQGLNETQKLNARNNIGAVSASDISAVKYTQNQGLNTDQQGYARANIAAAAASAVTAIETEMQGKLTNVVPYNAISLSETYPLPCVDSGYASRLINSCALWRFGPIALITFAFQVNTSINAGVPIVGFPTGYEMADNMLPLSWMIGSDGDTIIGLYLGEGGLMSPQTVAPAVYRGYLIYGLNNTLWPIAT